MRLRLFRRARQLVSRAFPRFSPSPQVGAQPAAKSRNGSVAGYKGVGARGSHRRTRGRPAQPESGRQSAPAAPATPAASDLAAALTASAPGTTVGGTGRLARPASWSSGPGRGQAGSGRPQPAVGVGARAAVRTRPAARTAPRTSQQTAMAKSAEATATETRPWFETRRSAHLAPGQRHCGCLEEVLCRDWATDAPPPAATVIAIDRLADLPQLIKEKLVAGLDAIYVGSGGVPDLDDMGELKGVALPSGRATWDACAGAYGDRKIIVGSRPSPTPDVMCHEVGHALDDIDGSGGCWQSDSDDFCRLYERCLPRMASEFHRQPGTLGKREFFADCFAAIASGQRPALVEMLSGDTRAALDVMLYFNVRYGI
jgi:hypothetical protein